MHIRNSPKITFYSLSPQALRIFAPQRTVNAKKSRLCFKTMLCRLLSSLEKHLSSLGSTFLLLFATRSGFSLHTRISEQQMRLQLIWTAATHIRVLCAFREFSEQGRYKGLFCLFYIFVHHDLPLYSVGPPIVLNICELLVGFSRRKLQTTRVVISRQFCTQFDTNVQHWTVYGAPFVKK